MRQLGRLFGFLFTFAIIYAFSPALAWIYGVGVPALVIYNSVGQRRARMRVAQAQRELQEQLLRAAQVRVEAARREQERLFTEGRRAADAATAARVAAEAEARRQQASAGAKQAPRGRPSGANGVHPRWDSSDPYTILGVSPGADATTIRNAYTTLASQYHPDKVARLAPEFQQLAEERMKAINAAYSRLRSSR